METMSAGRGRGAVVPSWMSTPQPLIAPGGLLAPPATSSAPLVPLLSTGPASSTTSAPSLVQMPPRIMPLQPWMEVKHPESGKIYYYNHLTQQSTFEKPDALKSVVERQLPTTTWREYVKDGKSYYVNSQTNQSVWEEPMELTTHKQRLTAMCAGEAPTRDLASLALYTAAKKALEDSIVDVDGSLARKREMQIQKEEEQVKRPKVELNLTIIEDPVMNYHLKVSQGQQSKISDSNQAEKVFEQLLVDSKVPYDATYEDALSIWHITKDQSRFTSLRTNQQRKHVFTKYITKITAERQQSTVEHDLILDNFALMLDELQSDKQLSDRSSVQAIATIVRLDPRCKALQSESERKELIEARIERLRSIKTFEREQEDKKRNGIVAQILDKAAQHGTFHVHSTLEDGLLFLNDKEHPTLKTLSKAARKQAVGRYLRQLLENEQLKQKEREREARNVLKQSIMELFEKGICIPDLRWEEFQAKHLQKVHPDSLLPLAGNVSVQERAFRDAREEGKRLVSDCGKQLRELNISLAGIKSVKELMTKLVNAAQQGQVEEGQIAMETHPQLDEIEKMYGVGIVNEALLEQSDRARREQDSFVQLLTREGLNGKDMEWSQIVDACKNRTAYREMAGNAARISAWEEAKKMPLVGHGQQRRDDGNSDMRRGEIGSSYRREDSRGRSKRRRTG